MKKLLYSLFAVLALSCTFVSCSDDNDDAPAPAGNPAEAAAATYSGTWTVVLDTDTVTTPGTVVLSAGDTAFVANVAVDVEPVKMKVGSSMSTISLKASEVTNIAFAGNANSFAFVNVGATLGNFSGRITDGNANMIFSTQQRVGRKRYTFNYTFEGIKQ